MSHRLIGQNKKNQKLFDKYSHQKQYSKYHLLSEAHDLSIFLSIYTSNSNN